MFRLPTTGKMLKIKFTSQQMVHKALTKGIVILHQFIPHYNIEKEIFVRLNPCRNCFAYDHKLKDCMQEKKRWCTFCGGGHKQAECSAVAPKCINCGGEHRTLAAACKIRKELIKRRSKEILEGVRANTEPAVPLRVRMARDLEASVLKAEQNHPISRMERLEDRQYRLHTKWRESDEAVEAVLQINGCKSQAQKTLVRLLLWTVNLLPLQREPTP